MSFFIVCRTVIILDLVIFVCFNQNNICRLRQQYLYGDIWVGSMLYVLVDVCMYHCINFMYITVLWQSQFYDSSPPSFHLMFEFSRFFFCHFVVFIIVKQQVHFSALVCRAQAECLANLLFLQQ